MEIQDGWRSKVNGMPERPRIIFAPGDATFRSSPSERFVAFQDFG
jgi:hypothetical protein